eukprot:TRINITY_DN774077_c0_g1_i1.p1 TRINITY_DN774077_c0_g1~~TRINITY_DN774077_c0_g1_i1.p1  ORF type:complete len:347 (+),score=96.81 TRINITY_DN774077_c0_g1_i1:47-1087(+)
MKLLFIFCLLLVVNCFAAKTIRFSAKPNDDDALVATLNIGHPAQQLEFLVVLGNSPYAGETVKNFVPNQTCKQCQEKGHHVFNETLSTTLKPTKKEDTSGCIMNSLKGHMDYDSLHIGKFAAENWYFFSVDQSCDTYDKAKGYDGVLSLTVPSTWADKERLMTLPLNLYDAGKIDKPYVTLKPNFATHEGDFILGGVEDESLNIQWVESQDYMWGFDKVKTGVLGTKKFDVSEVRFSTDVTYIRAPTKEVEEIYEFLNAGSYQGMGTVPCETYHSLPSLVFHLEDNALVELKPESYIIPNGDHCFILIIPYYGDNIWDLGSYVHFFNQFYFDYEIEGQKPRIGIVN